MFVNADDLEKLIKNKKHFDTDVTLEYLKKLHARHYSLRGKSNAVIIDYEYADDYLSAIINNWEDLIRVM